MFYIARSTPVSDAPAEFAEAWVDVPIRMLGRGSVQERNAQPIEGMLSFDSLPMSGAVVWTNREFAVHALKSFGRHEAAEWWERTFAEKLEMQRSELGKIAASSGVNWGLKDLQIYFPVQPGDEELHSSSLLRRFYDITGLVSTGQQYVHDCLGRH
jgi:hypothetical protein